MREGNIISTTYNAHLQFSWYAAISFTKMYKDMIISGIYIVQIDWLFWLYGISIFVGYLMPNPFLYKQFYLKENSVLKSTQFNYQKHLYFKLFSLVEQF